MKALKLKPTAQRVGYIRVSKSDMKEGRQIDGLEGLCDQCFVEKLSACKKARPVFDALIEGLREGQTLVILDLDRAFRSTIDALLTIEALRERGVKIHIKSLNLDYSNEFSEVIVAMVAALAQFERRTLIRRTREGMAAARARGAKIGRPRKLSDQQVHKAYRMVRDGQLSASCVAKRFRVAHSTLSLSFDRLGLV